MSKSVLVKLYTSDQSERLGIPGRNYRIIEKEYETIRYAAIEIEVEKNLFETYYICSKNAVDKLPELDILGAYFAVAFIVNEHANTVDKVGPYAS